MAKNPPERMGGYQCKILSQPSDYNSVYHSVFTCGKEDLMKIKVYLEQKFNVELAAEKINEMLNSIKQFEQFPFMSRPLMSVIDIPTDYMYFVLEKIYMFYRLEKETVKIIRIIDTRQNFINILFGNG